MTRQNLIFWRKYKAKRLFSPFQPSHFRIDFPSNIHVFPRTAPGLRFSQIFPDVYRESKILEPHMEPMASQMPTKIQYFEHKYWFGACMWSRLSSGDVSFWRHGSQKPFWDPPWSSFACFSTPCRVHLGLFCPIWILAGFFLALNPSPSTLYSLPIKASQPPSFKWTLFTCLVTYDRWKSSFPQVHQVA